MNYVISVGHRKGGHDIMKGLFASREEACEALQKKLRSQFDDDKSFDETAEEFGWDFKKGYAADEENEYCVNEI